jgi:hypothetical protein
MNFRTSEILVFLTSGIAWAFIAYWVFFIGLPELLK